MKGIVNHTDHLTSLGKLEWTNSLIKTISWKFYGFRDTEYFFWKLWKQGGGLGWVLDPLIKFEEPKLLSI